MEEIRFVVNGKVKKVLTGIPLPADPFAETGNFVRYDGEVALSELTAGVTGDAWLVIEAGRPLLLAGDLGGGLENAKDGVPDTTDNDGNGVVDAADVKEGAKMGPLADPPKPKRGETGYDYAAVTNGYPLGFMRSIGNGPKSRSTLALSRRKSRSCSAVIWHSTWAANASWISHSATSAYFMPWRANRRGMP